MATKAKGTKTPREPLPPGKKLIFRPWKKLPNGQLVHASQFGKRVFVFVVDE